MEGEDAKLEQLSPPDEGTPHSEMRFDVARETAISAQWNLDRNFLIMSMGHWRHELKVFLHPHAVKRLKHLLNDLDDEGDLRRG